MHFCIQVCFQAKPPMKRDFWEELKAEGTFLLLLLSSGLDWNKYYT